MKQDERLPNGEVEHPNELKDEFFSPCNTFNDFPIGQNASNSNAMLSTDMRREISHL